MATTTAPGDPTPDRNAPTGPALSRRAVAGTAAALAAAGLVGCTPESGSGLGGRTPGPALPPAPVADPDARLTTEAWAAETALLRDVRATQRRHPRLRARLERVRRAHSAHAAVLAGALPPEDLPTVTDAGPPPGVPAKALRALRRAEERLSRDQADRALRAESGALARVLAGTAASAAQHAHLLGEEP